MLINLDALAPGEFVVASHNWRGTEKIRMAPRESDLLVNGMGHGSGVQATGKGYDRNDSFQAGVNPSNWITMYLGQSIEGQQDDFHRPRQFGPRNC